MKHFFYLLILGLFISSCTTYHTDEEFRFMQKQKDSYIDYLQKSHQQVLEFYEMMANLHYSELNTLHLQLEKCH